MCVQLFEASAGMDRNQNVRMRLVARTFVLLRDEDLLRVPTAAVRRTLEDAGRVREVQFANNCTNQYMQELLANRFQQLRHTTISE